MLKNKCLRKILMAIMSAIILVNFIMPNYSLCTESDINIPTEEDNTDEDSSNLLSMPKNLLSGIFETGGEEFFDQFIGQSIDKLFGENEENSEKQQQGEENLQKIIDFFDPTKDTSSTYFNESNAEEEEEETNGVLIAPITKFLTGVCDGIISTLQGSFLGNSTIGADLLSAESIKIEGPEGVNTYRIKYSPAIIFSGEVPLFDINFFDPLGDKNGVVQIKEVKITWGAPQQTTYGECKQRLGAPRELQSIRKKIGLEVFVPAILGVVFLVNGLEQLGNTDLQEIGIDAEGSFVVSGGIDLELAMIPDIKGYMMFGLFIGLGVAGMSLAISNLLVKQHIYFSQWNYNGKTYFFVARTPIGGYVSKTAERDNLTGNVYELIPIEENVQKTSTAYTLRPTISKWYNTLRTVALIGLLSVLVYIGIRIIISSSAQDKSKYKKMLVDWIIAIFILYILHYLMVFMMKITQSIIKIFNITPTITSDGADILMTNIRNRIAGDYSYGTYFGYVLIYIAFTILTLSFTYQYLKRLIFIAFLTMIAPLIALTFPLDRVKDGQAQAFSMWLREYIFNCLLQPMHLLLYTMMIGTADNLVQSNPIYAIVVLAFFTPAEKFIRKMFGFEKASTLGPIGAATGGALVMNMLNKIKGKSSHNNGGGTGNSDSTKPVRTARKNDETESGENKIFEGEKQSSEGIRNSRGSRSNSETLNSRTTSGRTVNSTNGGSNTRKRPYSTKNGFNAVKNRYITGPDAIKSHKKRFHKVVGVLGGAATGFATGTVAMAANMVDGDLFDNTGKAIGEIGATAGVGYVAGKNTVENIQHGIERSSERTKEILKTFEKGSYEETTINNTDREFYNSKEYQKIAQDPKVLENYKGSKEEVQKVVQINTQQFLDNGIKDTTIIREAMREGISGNEYKAYAKAGIEDVEKMSKLKKKGYKPSQVAERCKLAKNAPKTMREFKAMFVGRNINGKTITDDEAEKIFKELEDFF